MYPYFLLEKYTAFEYCRYVFSAAGAKKWSWQYDGWALRKNCTFRHWYDMGGGRRDDFWVLPSEQELAASALRYSQLNQAFAVLHDLTGYLALYCKYPAVEYLWKMGFGRWLQEHDLPSMSSREIAALVKERDEAKEAAEKATAEKAAAELKFEGAAKARETVLHELKLSQDECDVFKQTAADLQKQLDAIGDKPAEVRELTEEELEEIREKVRAENAEAARAAEERARAAEEKLDKVKNPTAHKVNFLFGEVRGLVERLEQALEELQQTDEAACEKFAKVIADWLRKEGDRLA